MSCSVRGEPAHRVPIHIAIGVSVGGTPIRASIGSVYHSLIVVVKSQTGRNWAFIRASIEIMSHCDASKLMLCCSEVTLLSWCTTKVLQLKDFTQGRCERRTD
jgi:hypothetical protein